MDSVKAFLPFTDWKKAAGLFLIVVVFVAIATKFGVQKKVNALVGG